ncbi:glutathione S-transferase family protein [uncultured Tateyamaria sp.]|uniref:glutathione S-transferase family protein n=1 Tax=uncultured Tateyamaria sp. TaxID=455651 RepID=UPI00261DDF91|nr:glutathione S-transferase family protein [uncultured Tateyamaria sp.]
MTLEFWTVSGAPSPWRVALAMAFKGLTYDMHMLSAARKEHKADAYLALNPRGTVPTLKAGDHTLGHSIAILAWLDRMHPTPPLFGQTPEDAATIWQRTMEIFDHLPPATSGVLSPIFFDGATRATDALHTAADTLRAELSYLSGLLADDPFLSGAHPGAADAVAFPHVRLLQRAIDTNPQLMQALRFSALPADIAAWVTRIEALPGVEQTFPPHWSEAA